MDIVNWWEKEDSTFLYKLSENKTSGNIIYQINPNLVLFGTSSTLTKSEFNEEYNIASALIRIAIIEFLTENNASNVTSEIQFSYGTVSFDEGF